MKTRILNLNNSAYENGRVSGSYFFQQVKKEDIQSYINLMNKDKCKSLLDKLQREYPRYYEEVKGKADGLCLDVLEYFTCLCPEINNYSVEHCTSMIGKKDNGHFVLSHNEDDIYIDGNFCLSKVWFDDERWFMTNDMLNMPFGNGFSWNSYGIVKTINYCHDENVNVDALSRYFLQRHISEACSLEDVIQRCKEMKVASGFHVIALDIHKQEAISIEVYSDGMSILPIETVYVHTNHYLHNQRDEDPKVDEGSNSVFRLEKAIELLGAEYTKEVFKGILDYHSGDNQISVFQNKTTENITLANLTLDSEDGFKLYVSNYVDDELLKFVE